MPRSSSSRIFTPTTWKVSAINSVEELSALRIRSVCCYVWNSSAIARTCVMVPRKLSAASTRVWNLAATQQHRLPTSSWVQEIDTAADCKQTLNYNEPTSFSLGSYPDGRPFEVTITMLDANHCPGSSMFISRAQNETDPQVSDHFPRHGCASHWRCPCRWKVSRRFTTQSSSSAVPDAMVVHLTDQSKKAT